MDDFGIVLDIHLELSAREKHRAVLVLELQLTSLFSELSCGGLLT
jgi:hypothetical protein